MKKIFRMFFFILLMVICLQTIEAVMVGDINEDGKVNNKDESLIKNYLVSNVTEAEKSQVEKNGDLDGDGFITTKDATEINSIIKTGSSITGYSDANNCAGFRTESACKVGQTKDAGKFGCAWNEQYEFCSPNGLAYLSCGSEDSIAYDIPVMVPRLASYAITALKTITPVILIIIGMFQLIKAITSQNEDEMKKARSSLIKKLIAAVMIFFLVAIVQFVVKQVADDAEQSSTEACFDCFINNNCTNAMYYTDGYGNCYSVKTNKKLDSCPVDKY